MGIRFNLHIYLNIIPALIPDIIPSSIPDIIPASIPQVIHAQYCIP